MILPVLSHDVCDRHHGGGMNIMPFPWSQTRYPCVCIPLVLVTSPEGKGGLWAVTSLVKGAVFVDVGGQLFPASVGWERVASP